MKARNGGRGMTDEEVAKYVVVLIVVDDYQLICLFRAQVYRSIHTWVHILQRRRASGVQSYSIRPRRFRTVNEPTLERERLATRVRRKQRACQNRSFLIQTDDLLHILLEHNLRLAVYGMRKRNDKKTLS